MTAPLFLARPEILAMSAYSSARKEQATGEVWLNANENPWSETGFNRYPAPQPQALLSLLSTLYNVAAANMIVTRGSDEAIDILLRTFCAAGKDAIMITPPTYGMYPIAATLQGADVISVPLIKEQHFKLDVAQILKAWTPAVKLIFLCSPNNPTGNLLSATNILELCKALTDKAIVVVDEAYIEFSKTESLTKHLPDYANLIILRTLSKAYGLAGIRCGVALAHADLIQLFKKVIAPYPIPSLVADTIVKELTEERIKLAHKQIKILQQQRQFLFEFLSSLHWVSKVWPSEANYLLLQVSNADRIMQHCQGYGIVIRNRSKEYDLQNCIRITIGSPAENSRLMEVLDDV